MSEKKPNKVVQRVNDLTKLGTGQGGFEIFHPIGDLYRFLVSYLLRPFIEAVAELNIILFTFTWFIYYPYSYICDFLDIMPMVIAEPLRFYIPFFTDMPSIYIILFLWCLVEDPFRRALKTLPVLVIVCVLNLFTLIFSLLSGESDKSWYLFDFEALINYLHQFDLSGKFPIEFFCTIGVISTFYYIYLSREEDYGFLDEEKSKPISVLVSLLGMRAYRKEKRNKERGYYNEKE